MAIRTVALEPPPTKKLPAINAPNTGRRHPTATAAATAVPRRVAGVLHHQGVNVARTHFRAYGAPAAFEFIQRYRIDRAVLGGWVIYAYTTCSVSNEVQHGIGTPRKEVVQVIPHDVMGLVQIDITHAAKQRRDHHPLGAP